jgi:23S rRNA-/tRNA-specific pseudouridylate synthase
MIPDGSNLEKHAEVLFCDENLIVLNKHHGVPVIPERGVHPRTSLREMAECAFGQKLFVVHRIDRDTSGLLVFCRNAEITVM